MERSGKEKMLARVRAALGRGAEGAVAPAPLPPFSSGDASASRETLVARFVRELEAVGGSAAHVRSGADVRDYLKSLLSANEWPSVALSDSYHAHDLKIGEWLAEQGVSVIPAHDGFVTPAPEDEAAPAEGERDDLDARFRGGEDRNPMLAAGVGITSADYAIAETGTVVLVSGRERHRLGSLLPPVYVCLLNSANIEPDMAELLARLRSGFDADERLSTAVILITGPSCTADIEQTLTRGMHGPREIHVLLYTPPSSDDPDQRP
ncbi:MAG: lactate utilization protein [Acidobacteria bacterium]|nr:lactate utilization protein [Acidobacteriota bacterium]